MALLQVVDLEALPRLIIIVIVIKHLYSTT